MALSGHAKADGIVGSYAIQNVQTGKNIRPQGAKTHDGNPIVLYRHASWKCMTWEFNAAGNGVYQLENLYTKKTFEPSFSPADGTTLWQQPLRKDGMSDWKFIEQADGTYLIELNNADLYLTASADQINAPVILSEKSNTDAQRWKLVAQKPWF